MFFNHVHNCHDVVCLCNSYYLCDIDGTDLPKLHMLENVDYILVPEDAWKKLIKWYSLQNGQVCTFCLSLNFAADV